MQDSCNSAALVDCRTSQRPVGREGVSVGWGHSWNLAVEVVEPGSLRASHGMEWGVLHAAGDSGGGRHESKRSGEWWGAPWVRAFAINGCKRFRWDHTYPGRAAISVTAFQISGSVLPIRWNGWLMSGNQIRISAGG